MMIPSSYHTKLALVGISLTLAGNTLTFVGTGLALAGNEAAELSLLLLLGCTESGSR